MVVHVRRPLPRPQYYLLKVERDLWGLLDGPWGLPEGRGLEHRRLWVRAVREADTPQALVPRLLELEAAIRRWGGGGGSGGCGPKGFGL